MHRIYLDNEISDLDKKSMIHLYIDDGLKKKTPHIYDLLDEEIKETIQEKIKELYKKNFDITKYEKDLNCSHIAINPEILNKLSNKNYPDNYLYTLYDLNSRPDHSFNMSILSKSSFIYNIGDSKVKNLIRDTDYIFELLLEIYSIKFKIYKKLIDENLICWDKYKGIISYFPGYKKLTYLDLKEIYPEIYDSWIKDIIKNTKIMYTQDEVIRIRKKLGLADLRTLIP